MAKKKKVKRTYRRRVGAAKGGMAAVAMKVGGIVVGMYGASIIKKTLTSLSPTVLGAGEIVVGAMLPRFIGKGNALIEGVADGFIAKGSLDLMTGLGVAITGIGTVPVINPYLAPPVVSPRPGGKLSTRAIGNNTINEMVKIGALISN